MQLDSVVSHTHWSEETVEFFWYESHAIGDAVRLVQSRNHGRMLGTVVLQYPQQSHEHP